MGHFYKKFLISMTKCDQKQQIKKSDILQSNMLLSIHTSGQSYKHFTIVIYNSRVVLWSIF